ncbi:MAG: aminotransferase class III-fold pyridoxal phosphate-dependent enzyme [Candidatus Aminicenantes bacterium]|nr:aminotransferase class III-fold pyridoxal phosphate-dependent enzyme [Candidatus Aminicenantes bacterium]NIM77437.1 aminotransferase class III-fold pyridoxal phosphate-dependent enzyme [Candidatus Aminicenantes bacterium]NIN19530.1 aminotransferase class III-fold pyridoxal phosphate-dependent enzyme [Candidatus Aminicenantes bacterium]NIN43424.1 aminotransferase class III-fold pyridoxal phosphate-dependent enzyme [Candidatus Aminicenantes bacterium]NIN86169.1 aminotransferase class III-fold 
MSVDKDKLLRDLIKRYRQTHKKSEALFKKASQLQIKGGSHNLRLFTPFPFYDVHSSGSTVTDIDGNTYIDFWQGHFGNILGHNPRIVVEALTDWFQKGQGLATGFPGNLQMELAELILKQIGTDKIRFTTSGTLSTMYATMLARAFTKRELVMKVGGGWHGAQPFALKGITAFRNGLNQMESAGLFPEHDSSIIITTFNDSEDLKEKFKKFGERIACLIIEPFIGAGGFIFAKREYLEKVRELTHQYEAVLIFDEVVSGFRFHAGGVQSIYGIKPDLSVFGKAIGGGMPLSAVAGKNELMELCNPDIESDRNVKFEGGTYSAHPATMLAGVTFIKYLIKHEKEIYPKIGRLGAKVRKEIEEIFSTYGFQVKCTGGDNTVTENSSVVGVHFTKEKVAQINYPEEAWNPGICDFQLREKIFKLSMLNEGFHVFHGYGAISTAHTEEEIQASLDAVERIAKKWTKYRL